MTEQKNKTLSAKEAALDDKQDVEIDLEKDGDSIVGGAGVGTIQKAGRFEVA